MTDEQKFLRFIKSLGLNVKKFDDPRFLFAHEIYKQDVAYSLHREGAVDFNFKKGKFIGINTSSINSFELPKKLNK